MRRIVVLVTATLVAGVWAPATAAASRPLDGQLTGTITSRTRVGMDAYETSFEGRGAISGIGAVSFTGLDLLGCGPEPSLDGCVRSFRLTISTRSGATLTLAGDVVWAQTDPPPPVPWTVVQTTGRFTRYAGSGTYEVVSNDKTTGGRMVVRLDGVLRSR